MGINNNINLLSFIVIARRRNCSNTVLFYCVVKKKKTEKLCGIRIMKTHEYSPSREQLTRSKIRTFPFQCLQSFRYIFNIDDIRWFVSISSLFSSNLVLPMNSGWLCREDMVQLPVCLMTALQQIKIWRKKRDRLLKSPEYNDLVVHIYGIQFAAGLSHAT